MWYVDMITSHSKEFANFESCLTFVKECKNNGDNVEDWRICYFDEDWSN